MSRLPLVVALAAVTAPALAQTSSAPNLVLANNSPYVTTDTAANAATGVAYNLPDNNPGTYSDGTGIPPGTWVWRVYPKKTDVMREPRNITGFQTIWRASAATPPNVPVAVYAPAIRLMGAVQRPGAATGALDPDFSNTWLTVPEYTSQFAFSGTSRVLSWNVTLAHPVTLNFTGDHAIAAAYHGGDERDVAATAGTPSQGVMGSLADAPVFDESVNPLPFQPDGFAFVDPFTQAVTLTYKRQSDSRTWLTYGTANPTINVFSDWGRMRLQAPPTQAQIVGYSDGSYYADLGANTSTGWGLEVWADPATFGGGYAVPLVNIGSYFAGSVPVPLGSAGTPVLELQPNDPFFGVLASNLVIALSPAPDGTGQTVSLPQLLPLPGLIGGYLGFEAAVLDSNLTRVTTTQARWVRIR